MHSLFRRSASLSLFLFACAHSALAQCAQWDERFTLRGMDNYVASFASIDDGSGPRLYAGGTFTIAGGAAASRIARWDGSEWSPLGGGISGLVSAIAGYDDGAGTSVYAGGMFASAGGAAARGIAKWDGATWSVLGAGLGTNNSVWVRGLCTFDDGSGTKLYVVGTFATAGGMNISGLARWDGANWSTVGGVTVGGGNELVTFDDGTGLALYLAGGVTLTGGTQLSGVVKWDGTSWSALGSASIPFTPLSLAVCDDGSGPTLFAGAVNGRVVKWNGSAWSQLGIGMDGRVNALASCDHGAGPVLYAGGQFSMADGVPAYGIMSWNGTSWSAVGGGGVNQDTWIYALASIDDGSGTKLYTGGAFTSLGGVMAPCIARWNGSAWSALTNGDGVFGSVTALAVHDEGNGPALYAGGLSSGVGAWSGASWSPVGNPLEGGLVYALEWFDDGAGTALYAGGSFLKSGSTTLNHIAKWDGSNWLALHGGVENSGSGLTRVNALIAFDDGNGAKLYAGGAFNKIGGVTAGSLAAWDGQNWSRVGAGITGLGVIAMTVFDDGSGDALYVAGQISNAGGVSVANIAKWDGTSWSALGTGLVGNRVLALSAFDDGTGPALYAGGIFTLAGGVAVSSIAKWNGAIWSNVGGGVSGVAPEFTSVNALEVFDEGSGPVLVAGGQFTSAGGTPALSIARWDGVTWSVFGSGIGGAGIGDAQVNALASFDAGTGAPADLYAGGRFSLAGDAVSVSIARWQGCGPGSAYCYGDGIDPVVTVSCPCGNDGAPGHGCANSNASLGGAWLEASGSARANDVVLSAHGIPNQNLASFVSAGIDVVQGASFGDGLTCVVAPFAPFGQQVAGSGTNASHSVRASPPIGTPGTTRFYQVIYRNPAGGFCGADAVNASNAYAIHW